LDLLLSEGLELSSSLGERIWIRRKVGQDGLRGELLTLRPSDKEIHELIDNRLLIKDVWGAEEEGKQI